MADLDIEQLLCLYTEWNLVEYEFLDFLRNDFFRQKDAFVAVWAPQGRYKSALRVEPYGDGLLIASFCTAPNERRKGYGYLLVTEVLKHLSTCSYKVVYSHIDKKNHPSIHLHKKCGFQLFTDYAKYLDGTVTYNSFTMNYLL